MAMYFKQENLESSKKVTFEQRSERDKKMFHEHTWGRGRKSRSAKVLMWRDAWKVLGRARMSLARE